MFIKGPILYHFFVWKLSVIPRKLSVSSLLIVKALRKLILLQLGSGANTKGATRWPQVTAGFISSGLFTSTFLLLTQILREILYL